MCAIDFARCRCDVDFHRILVLKCEAFYFQLFAERVWNINLQKKQQTITNIVSKRPNGKHMVGIKWAASSEFMSSSIPSWHILTVHAQPFRGARDLAFCLKVPLDSLLVWASSEGSGETARMRGLAWTFAARIGDKYQIRLTRSKL